MAKYKIYSHFGYAGSPEYFGIVDADTQEEADDLAWEAATERVDSFAVLVDDDAEDEPYE